MAYPSAHASCRTALALALAWAVSGAQASPVPAQSSVTLDQLSWRLVDLAPEDGISPSVSFTGDWRYTGLVNNAFTERSLTGRPFPASSDTIASSGTSTTVSPTSLSVSSVFMGGYRMPPESEWLPGHAMGIDARSAQIEDQLFPPQTPSGIAVKLSPNTQLIVEGQARLNAFADARFGVRTQSGGDMTVPYTHTVYADSKLSAYLTPLGPGTSAVAGSQWLADASVADSFDSQSATDPLLDQPSSKGIQKAFSLSLTNHSGDSVDANLALGMWSSVGASVTVAAVPESGTWALMALGLIGVALARQRRRARRAAQGAS